MANNKVKNQKDVDESIAALSNPFSTGGGGFNFEFKVQATFLLTLLIDGFSPVLNRKVTRIDFQSKLYDRKTDDLTVISSIEGVESKLYCQIKHGIHLTEKTVFKDVLVAAWADFKSLNFNKNRDFIVLITAQTPKADVLRAIHDQANYSADEFDFNKRIYQSNYSNKDNRDKLDIIKKCLKFANGNEEISMKDIWEFCKAFTILVFDIDYESSVNHYLIQSLIATNSENALYDIWDSLIVYAMNCDKNAASVTRSNLPERIKKAFISYSNESISQNMQVDISYTDIDIWHKLALVGAWDEKNEYDTQLIEDYIGKTYKEIQKQLRQNSIVSEPMISYSNGVWRIINRESLIVSLSKLYFDDDINDIFNLSVSVYLDKDKRIQPDGSFSLLSVSGKNYKYSENLRASLIEGLAIISNKICKSCSCSYDTIDYASKTFVKDIFANNTVSTWISLDTFLRTIAEICPSQYLSELENTILNDPETIESLFPRKNANLLISRNPICSVLWSVEILAWIEEYFNKCIRILGELSNLRYDNTNSANTPINSIVSIMLPWYPQTLASVEKQKHSLKCLQTNYPSIAWKVLKRLLPGSTTNTTGNVKPRYISVDIPEQISVTQKQLTEVQKYYSQLAIELAQTDDSKLHDLLKYFDHMDVDSITSYLSYIIKSSGSWNDDIKYPIWSKIIIKKEWLLYHHKKLNADLLILMDNVIEKTKPTDIRYLYRLTYESSYSEHNSGEDWHTKRDTKELHQKKQILEIYKTYGIAGVIEFGESINKTSLVARNLGCVISVNDLRDLLKKAYNEKIDDQFFGYVVNSYVFENRVGVLKELNLEEYDYEYSAHILTHINPTMELFPIVEDLLGDNIGLYWKKYRVSYFGLDETYNMLYIWENLMKVKRTVAAINIFNSYTDASGISTKQIEDVLVKAAKYNGKEELNPDSVRFLINVLQNRDDRDIKCLCDIELIYLLWLDENSSTKPKTLRYRLANDPGYFCFMISLMYKKKSADKHDRDIPKPMADRLFEIFFKYDVIPGTDWDGHYDEEEFHNWIKYCKEWAKREDRWEVVMQTIGNGLSYATKNDDGLIDDFIMKELDRVDNEEMRRGYYLGIFNQRGVTWYDPEGKPEYKLADHYNELADKAEARGYSRYSETLRFISKSYIKEAEHHIEMHKKEQFMDE